MIIVHTPDGGSIYYRARDGRIERSMDGENWKLVLDGTGPPARAEAVLEALTRTAVAILGGGCSITKIADN